LYGDQGNPVKQRELLERVLAIQEEAYGPSYPQVAITLKALASAHGALGELQKEVIKVWGLLCDLVCSIQTGLAFALRYHSASYWTGRFRFCRKPTVTTILIPSRRWPCLGMPLSMLYLHSCAHPLSICGRSLHSKARCLTGDQSDGVVLLTHAVRDAEHALGANHTSAGKYRAWLQAVS